MIAVEKQERESISTADICGSSVGIASLLSSLGSVDLLAFVSIRIIYP